MCLFSDISNSAVTLKIGTYSQLPIACLIKSNISVSLEIHSFLYFSHCPLILYTVIPHGNFGIVLRLPIFPLRGCVFVSDILQAERSMAHFCF